MNGIPLPHSPLAPPQAQPVPPCRHLRLNGIPCHPRATYPCCTRLEPRRLCPTAFLPHPPLTASASALAVILSSHPHWHPTQPARPTRAGTTRNPPRASRCGTTARRSRRPGSPGSSCSASAASCSWRRRPSSWPTLWRVAWTSTCTTSRSEGSGPTASSQRLAITRSATGRCVPDQSVL